jgi:predicted ATPase
MVGRGPALAALGALMSSTSMYRNAIVVGEAGVGKSRLVETAVEHHRAAQGVALVGACLPLSESLPLLPFVDIVRAVEAVDAGRLLGGALEKTRPFVRDVIDRLLSAAPGSTSRDSRAASAGMQQTFEAVRQLLATLCLSHHVAVVVEDVHWADTSTLDLLEYLMTPARASGAALIVTFRDRLSDEDHRRAEALLEQATRDRRTMRLALSPLSAEEVAEQIAALTGAVPDPSFAAMVYRRAQGNPFFTEQIVAHSTTGDDPFAAA